MFGRHALQNKANKAVAIAVVYAVIDIDNFVVLVISLLKIIDNGFGLRRQLPGQDISRCRFPKSEFDCDRVEERVLPDEVTKDVTAYAKEAGIKHKSEAIRKLIEEALAKRKAADVSEPDAKAAKRPRRK